jgi:hypothetical protein
VAGHHAVVLQRPLQPHVVLGPDVVRDILHPDPALTVGLLDDTETSRRGQAAGQIIQETRLIGTRLAPPIVEVAWLSRIS